MIASTTRIIEGPDAGGKTTFINRLNDYFRGEGEYAKIVHTALYNSLPARQRFHARKHAFSDPKRNRKEIEFWKTLRQYGVAFGMRQADLEAGSPENRAFLRSLRDGTVAPGVNIDAELLQAYFDLYNLTEHLAEMHELVISNGSLMQFYVQRVLGNNRPDLRKVVEMMLIKTGQDQQIVWLLRCRPETLQARYKAKTGIELPLEHFEQQNQFYHEAAFNSDLWKRVFVVDVEDTDPDAYRMQFASLAFQIGGQAQAAPAPTPV